MNLFACVVPLDDAMAREAGGNGDYHIICFYPRATGTAIKSQSSILQSHHQHHPPWSRRRDTHIVGHTLAYPDPHLTRMPLLSASADSFLLAATVSVCLIAFVRRRHTPALTKNARQPKHWPLVTTIIAIHTLYMMYNVSFKSPQNLFTRLHLPLSTPSEMIRAILLSKAGMREEDLLPDHIEELLMKLNTSDLRTHFVRFVPALCMTCVINVSTLIPLDQPGSARTRFSSVSGAQPFRSMRRTRFPSSCCPTSRKPHFSEW